jgi:hypothetical protein
MAKIKSVRRSRYPWPPCCADCSVDTHSIGEDYMVGHSIWAQAGIGRHDGYLCIGCLEQRLGRKLARSDFIDVPINTMGKFYRSDRLRDRLSGDAPLLAWERKERAASSFHNMSAKNAGVWNVPPICYWRTRAGEDLLRDKNRN